MGDAPYTPQTVRTNRNPWLVVLAMVVLLALSLPARLAPAHLPYWYVRYFGDVLWAMLLFFGITLVLNKATTLRAAAAALVLAYLVEVTQLFHPPWLDHLRSFPLVGLLIGYGFLWSDIAAYTLGIGTGALIDHYLLRRFSKRGE